MSSDQKDPKDQKKYRWEDMIFSTFERIASTPGRLRDPKESLASAFDWVKDVREEIADRVKEEVATRVRKLDWNQMPNRVAEHLAQNFNLKIEAKLTWEPKHQPVKVDNIPQDPDHQDFQESDSER